MKTTILNAGIAVALLATATSTALAAKPAYLDTTLPLEERIDDAMSRMTLEEKVAMCHAQSKFSSPGVARLGIPELWMSDGPHGVRAEINWDNWKYASWTNDSVTAFPALTALAATWNRDMALLYGRSVGAEARYRDKDVLLGPGVNIYRTPLCGRNFEYLGEDPYLAGEMASRYVRGVQENGVAACVKHFALNNQEKWRGEIDVEVSPRALREIYLPAFHKALVEGGAWSVMGAYNRWGGRHCCHNKALLCDLLRDEWGWDGVVISDWGGTHDTRQAALEGLDLEMGTHTNGLTSQKSGFTVNDYYLARPYLEALRSGALPDSSVNAKARNMLRLIMRTAMNGDKPAGALCSNAHYEAARAIGNEAVVLMKNERNTLPLEPVEGLRVLVVGENATRDLMAGGGSAELKVKDLYTPLEAIRSVYGPATQYAEGYRSGRPRYGKEDIIPEAVLDSLRRQAVEMARQADAVIYIGGLNKNGFQDCESTDRREYNLPWGQDRLIEELAGACPLTIVACISGNAYAMPWLKKVPAVVQSWYLGTMTGPVMADVISGRVNPSGKLPFTFPVRLEDCNAHRHGPLSYPGVINEADSLPRQQYLDDILVGYRWHDTGGVKPAFAFGHGLSYTTFSYGKMTIKQPTDSTFVISLPVTNTGRRAGRETVQLYIADEVSSLPRPAKELKGFEKVSLEPGETATVTFTIGLGDLSFYDPDKGRWVAEPGKFRALAGASSSDIRARATFTLGDR